LGKQNDNTFILNDAVTANNALKVATGGPMQLMPVAGNVLIATTSDDGTNKMQVSGSIWTSTSLKIRDTSAAFDVSLAATSSTTLTAGRTLTLDLANAARTLKLTGNPTLADWFDQSVKTTASPTFVGATFSGAVSGVTTFTTADIITSSKAASASTYTGLLVQNAAAIAAGNTVGFNLATSPTSTAWQIQVVQDSTSVGDSRFKFHQAGAAINAFVVNSAGGLTIADAFTTAAPAGASAGAWKLGSLVTGLSLTANLTQAVYIDIGGTVYKLLTGS